MSAAVRVSIPDVVSEHNMDFVEGEYDVVQLESRRCFSWLLISSSSRSGKKQNTGRVAISKKEATTCKEFYVNSLINDALGAVNLRVKLFQLVVIKELLRRPRRDNLNGQRIEKRSLRLVTTPLLALHIEEEDPNTNKFEIKRRAPNLFIISSDKPNTSYSESLTVKYHSFRFDARYTCLSLPVCIWCEFPDSETYQRLRKKAEQSRRTQSSSNSVHTAGRPASYV